MSKYLTPDIANETSIKITIPDNTVSEYDEANNRGYLAKVRVQ